MTPKQKIIKVCISICASISIAFGILASLEYLSEYMETYHFNDWPQEGKELAISEMERYMISHYCDPQMDVFGYNSEGEYGYLFRNERRICQNNHQLSGWGVNDTKVTAYFRCDLNDRWGDYAVTIYRQSFHGNDQSWCNFMYILKTEDKGIVNNLTFRHR